MRRRRLLESAVGLAIGARVARGIAGDDSGGGESVDVELAAIPPGAIETVRWQGEPIFVRHRTQAEIDRARSVDVDALRDPERDTARVERPAWLVVIGVCTHAGCIPNGPLGQYGGWYCLCHGSQFDTSGRIREGPARNNLQVPPYRFVTSSTIRIGEPA